MASTALSLPAPTPSDAPTLKSIPPAPTDGPPPRATRTATTRLALAAGLSGNLIAPSVLRQTVASGLKSPTDLAFSGDGVLFYTERASGLYAQRTGQAAVQVFAPKDLVTTGPSGMLAVAVDPEFSRNRYVFVFMRASAEGHETSRVVRLTLDESRSRALDRRDILIVASASTLERAADSEPQFGGGMRFGPDGYLYVGLGDERSAPNSQSPNVLAGKMLRIDRNGQAAPGNHAPAGFDERVFAYGLRNPVAVAFHPNTEALLIAQQRGAQPDNVVLTRAGTNVGWDPRCASPGTGYCDRAEDQVAALPTGVAPSAWRGGRSGEGLTAIERLRDPMWQEWRNAFVVAFDHAQRLDIVKFDVEGRVVQAITALAKLGVGFKAVAQAPDGLYVVTSGKAGGEEIWRLTAR